MKTRTTRNFIFAAVCALALIACTKPSIEIGTSSITFDGNGGNETVTFESALEWTASAGADWITVSPLSGAAGSASVTVTAPQNLTGAERSGLVTITSETVNKTVSVKQAAYVSLKGSDKTETVPFTGATIDWSFEYFGAFKVESNATWISVSETKADEKASLKIAVAANEGDARTGKVTVTNPAGSLTLTVNQDAFVETFSVSQTEVKVGKDASTFDLAVTANVKYSVSNKCSFISNVKDNGNDTYTFSVEANDSYSERTGSISFESEKGTVIEVSVSQNRGDATLAVSTALASFAKEGGSNEVTVTSNCGWSVSSDAEWVMVSPASGSGNGAFTITVDPITTVEERTANVTVVSEDKAVTRVIVVKQEGIPATLEISACAFTVGAIRNTVQVLVKSNTSWTVEAADNWVVIDPVSGKGDGSFTIEVLPNFDGERTTTVTVKTTNGAVTSMISLSQADANSNEQFHEGQVIPWD